MLAEIDPIADLTKTARKLRNLLGVDDSFKISILGVLHQGRFDKKRFNPALRGAYCTTLELPSVAVNAFLSGKPTKISGFWAGVLSGANRLVGVKNNASAVMARRLVTDQWPNDSELSSVGPVFIISTNKTSQLIPRKILVCEEIPEGITGNKPSSWGDYDFAVYHLLKPPVKGDAGQIEALVAFKPWESPMKFLVEGHRGISLSLVEEAVQHFIRVRIDKTQVKGILDQSLKTLKARKYQVLHIGGIDHSPNILNLLKAAFGDDLRVKVEDLVKPSLNMRNFFARHIPIVDALSATAIFEDFLFIHKDVAERLIREAILQGQEDLIKLGQID